MNWKNIHIQTPYGDKSRMPEYKNKTPFTPTRKSNSQIESPLRKKSFSGGRNKIQAPEQIPFYYQATTEWVIRLKKQLKGLFKQFHKFCQSIQKEVMKMNSKYRKMIEFYQNHPNFAHTVFGQFTSQDSRNADSPVKEIHSAIRIGNEKVTVLKSLQKESDDLRKLVSEKAKTDRIFSHTFETPLSSQLPTRPKHEKNIDNSTSQINSSTINRVPVRKASESIMQMNERIEKMKKILHQEKK